LQATTLRTGRIGENRELPTTNILTDRQGNNRVLLCVWYTEPNF
jgi:hypothetical protein